MKIEFEFKVSPTDQKVLAETLDCSEEKLGEKLSGHANAALHEYVECYLGRRVSSRGSEILEHRLALLTILAFQKQIPSESKVSRLFQTTPSRSRTMIRNMLARYRNELDGASKESARAVLENVTSPGANSDSYRAKNPATNVVELLNQRLLALDPTLSRITRVPSSSGVYAIHKETYDQLCKEFGATAVERK